MYSAGRRLSRDGSLLALEARSTAGASSPARWRVFCAIQIPDEVGGSISQYIHELQNKFPNLEASWNRQEKFHLTLKFFAGIAPDRVSDLSHAASAASKSVSPFPLFVGGSGTFPKNGPPRVLWIGVNDPTNKLHQLHERLEEECSQLGLAREERSLHPHVTIARFRKSRGVRGLAREHLELGFPPIEISVKELTVYRSQLGRNGSTYSVLSTHPIGAA